MRSVHRNWTLALDDETVLVGDDQGPPDAPAIVLLHGLASNLRWWDPVAARLALRHRLVRFDHRGHGRSTGPAAGYTVQRLAADSAAVLDHLHVGCHRQMTVIGARERCAPRREHDVVAMAPEAREACARRRGFAGRQAREPVAAEAHLANVRASAVDAEPGTGVR